MQFTFAHNNLNVRNLKESIAFYEQALGLRETKRIEATDGSFLIVFLGDGRSVHKLELTWLRDRKEKYNLGDNEFHLAFETEIWIQPCNAIGRWAASALKTRRWESTLSPIRTAIGLRLFQLNRKGCPQNTTGYKASKRKRPGGFRAALLQLNSVSVLHC